jgi:hypothetical protein
MVVSRGTRQACHKTYETELILQLLTEMAPAKRECDCLAPRAALGYEGRHFDVVSEATRHEIRLVAESVANVNERLDREAGDIRDEMRRGFAETLR